MLWIAVVDGIYTAYSFWQWHQDKSAKTWEFDWHIAIPLTVLAAEFFMLIKMLGEATERAQESQERKDTEEEMRKVREAFGREHYLGQIQQMVGEAKEAFLFTSVSMQASWANQEQKKILEAVIKRKKGRDYDHRGVVAKRTAVLPGALEMAYRGQVEIRVSHVPDMSRVRFCVCDAAKVLFGVAEGPPRLSPESASNRSVAIESGTVAVAMVWQFEKIWEEAICLYDYFDELILTSLKTIPCCTRESFRALIQANEAKVPDSWLAEKSKCFLALTHFEFLVHCSAAERKDCKQALSSFLNIPNEINPTWMDAFLDKHIDFKTDKKRIVEDSKTTNEGVLLIFSLLT